MAHEGIDLPQRPPLHAEMSSADFYTWCETYLNEYPRLVIAIRKEELNITKLLDPSIWKDEEINKIHQYIQVPIGIAKEFINELQRARQASRNIVDHGVAISIHSRQIQHDDPRFTFPIPIGIDPPVPWTQLDSPPFLNRQKAILRLLLDCYSNYYYQYQEEDRSINLRLEKDAPLRTKPVAAILGTARGYGKTRLLLEWAIRVFHDNSILSTFLTMSQSGFNVNNVNEYKGSFKELSQLLDNKDQNNSKATFLCTLHRTLKQSAVISASMLSILIPNITDPNDRVQVAEVADKICRTIVAKAICDRFKHRTVKLKGKMITFPRGLDVLNDNDHIFLEENGLYQQFAQSEVLFSLFALFLELLDTKVETIGQVGPYPLVLINIDEAQALMDIEALNRTLAFEVIKQFYEVQRHLDVKVFVFMTGLVTKSLPLLQDATAIFADVSLPLNPLMKPDYFRQILNLYKDINLTKAGKRLVKELWNRCLGIPRAIQILHGVIHSNLDILKLDEIPDDQQRIVIRHFYDGAKKYFGKNDILDHKNFKVAQHEWTKFIVECCLGVAKHPTDTFSGSMTYSDLERNGTIFPIEFYEAEDDSQYRQYTMPFLFFTSLLIKQIDLLIPTSPVPGNVTCILPTIGDIVGNNGSESIQVQGNSLECACAISLWARYKLAAAKNGELIQMKTLVPSWPKDNHYVCLNGVGEAKKPIHDGVSHPKALKKILTSNFIVINKASTKFADVLVPIWQLTPDTHSHIIQGLMNLEDCWNTSGKLLLIQCCNVQQGSSSVAPAFIATKLKEQNMIKLLQIGHFFVLMFDKALWQRAEPGHLADILKDYKDNIIETNGKDWLSELFLFVNTKHKVMDEDVNDDEEENEELVHDIVSEDDDEKEEDDNVSAKEKQTIGQKRKRAQDEKEKKGNAKKAKE